MSDSEETSSPIDFESYLDKKGHESRAHPPGITHGQESVYFNLNAVDMMNLSKGISVIAAPDTDKEVPQFFVCEVGPDGYTLSGLGEGSGLNTSSNLIENLGEEFQSDNNQWYELEETEMTSQWNTPVFRAILRDEPPSPQEDESTEESQPMGKNYYIETKRHHCKCCEQRLPEPEDERIHIGKSSGGWAFHFRAYPEGIDWLQKEDPNTILETVQCWKEFMRRQVRDGAVIYDEYGKAIDLEDFWEKVESKKGQKTVYDVSVSAGQPHPKDKDDHFVEEQCSFSSREFS